ncbi:hypothetical protein QVO10_04455 [Bacteroides gallinaceum]|uniref:Uncharacterized protein n=1 Tax=Bacteroides gallinaceum TaxID=1462571 RepID=A0ABT7X3M6_9BACE|nr:hypothetical protein [Bacteroides gallinaceum]MDN0048644.1 hypothetical protein [Bacteroides gallinaceum]
MVKINLNNFRRSDGSLFVYRPKVYFDNLCFEYGEKTIDEKLEILSELVANGMNLVSEIERYMKDRSPNTLASLKNTLAYYFLYLKGEDPYLTGFHGLDDLPEIRLAAMLQESLVTHYDDIHFKNSIEGL